MELDREELSALARFIARRMGPEVLLDPTDAPPAPDPVEAWTALLEQAQAEGRLSRLVRRIAAQRPDDHALQEACRLLGGDGAPARPVRLPRVALAVALAALIGVGVLLGPRLVGPPEPEPVRVEVALQPQSIEADEVVAALGYAEPEVALVEAGPPPAEEPADDEPAEVATARVGDCGAQPGELVGYWYAGEQPPGTAGEVVVVPTAVNVRAAYPDAANDFDTRAPVRCVLGAGARVRLSADPIPVPRESWWVPLVSGDVLSDRTG